VIECHAGYHAILFPLPDRGRGQPFSAAGRG
jgi:hypothetical protein